jgi:HSP20 family protein
VAQPFGPFVELTRLQNELNRIFAAILEGDRTGTALGWDPALDVVDAGDRIRIFVELPGIAASAIRITAKGPTITISGTKGSPPQEAGGKKFHCLERFFGAFSKSLTLTAPVNTHKGCATLLSGVLCIELPKIADLRSKEVTIPVTEGSGDPAAHPCSSDTEKAR